MAARFHFWKFHFWKFHHWNFYTWKYDFMPASPPSAPVRPLDIADRLREWDVLGALWASPRAELAFVLGRRRVGKSYLLGRFAHEVGGLYYQATRRTEAEQLTRLSLAIGERFDDTALRLGRGFADWESLLAYLVARASGAPFLLVLDEFPYLAESAPALASILQSWWDHQTAGTALKLVLSGSHITAMRRLEATDQPLYGRRTRRLAIAPFSPDVVTAFVPAYDASDTLLTYGIVGGLPGHLSLMDPAVDLVDNVSALLLDTGGRLADEAEHMLDAFLDDAAVHYSILEAVATGDQTWKGITNRIGRSGGAALRPLEWLVDMQVLERVAPITERDPRKAKRVVYRVSDPYIAFWHRFIAPLVTSGALGLVPPERLWSIGIAPHLDDYMGAVFEGVCRQAVRSGRITLPFEPVRVGEWWNATSTEQIDLVALGGNRELFVAECKWGSVTAGDLAQLERRAQLLAADLGGVRKTHLAVFSGNGRHGAGVAAAIVAGRVSGYSALDVI